MPWITRPFIFLVMGCMLQPFSLAADADREGALAFFAEYQQLYGAFDGAVADLYDDGAAISSLRRYPTGQTRKNQFPGAQYKKLIRSAMPLAKQKNDRSTYKVTGVEIEGAIATIKAERFSTLKCYTDSGFFIRVRRDENGKYMIIEEHTETQAHSECE